jgi:uracil phosphoribosyltransferase
MFRNLTVVDHPLVQTKLTIMRQKDTKPPEFRRLLREISMLLAYEVTRDTKLTTATIETPLTTMDAPVLAEKDACIVSILRAGNGILDGMLDLMPTARVGHIGLYRDPSTLAAVEYYFKVPQDIAERHAIVVDPMLATGNSSVAAVNRLLEVNPLSIKYVCLVAAPEGVKAMLDAHPAVPVFAAALDSHLDAHSYIVPGLGDAGDRLYGTK